jgi:hypothetical protein
MRREARGSGVVILVTCFVTLASGCTGQPSHLTLGPPARQAAVKFVNAALAHDWDEAARYSRADFARGLRQLRTVLSDVRRLEGGPHRKDYGFVYYAAVKGRPANEPARIRVLMTDDSGRWLVYGVLYLP